MVLHYAHRKRCLNMQVLNRILIGGGFKDAYRSSKAWQQIISASGMGAAAGCQCHELFGTAGIERTDADQDPTNALLRKSCEGRFEIAGGSGIHDNELQAQRAR